MTVNGTEVTLGEVARRLDGLHQDIRDLRTAVVERDDLQAVANSWHLLLNAAEQRATDNLHNHARESEARMVRLEARVKAIEGWGIWAVRVVGGILITAVLAVVVAKSGLG